MLTIEKAGGFLFLGLMSLFDIKSKRLPDVSVILSLVSAVLVRIAFKGLPLKSYVAAMVVGVTFMLISYFTDEKIGYGDSLVILFIGILLGFENLLFIIFSALVMCLVTGVVMIIVNDGRKDLTLPFVPFMFAAFVMLVIFSGINL